MHDFDLDCREVRFRRAISTDYDGSLLEKDIKTHASRLALDEGTVRLLRQHKLRQREDDEIGQARQPDAAAALASEAQDLGIY